MCVGYGVDQPVVYVLLPDHADAGLITIEFLCCSSEGIIGSPGGKWPEPSAPPSEGHAN